MKKADRRGHRPSSYESSPSPVGKIVRVNLCILAGAQGLIFLLSRLEGGEGAIYGFMFGSLVYLALHNTVLGFLMLVKFVQGEAPVASAYLAAMGLVLLIGGGTCFAGAAG
jgi:hypothetical protein